MKLQKVSVIREKQRVVSHTEVMNPQMIPLLKSSPLMVMSPCSLKLWCDVKTDLCLGRWRKRVRQVQNQLRVVRVKNVPNERA